MKHQLVFVALRTSNIAPTTTIPSRPTTWASNDVSATVWLWRNSCACPTSMSHITGLGPDVTQAATIQTPTPTCWKKSAKPRSIGPMETYPFSELDTATVSFSSWQPKGSEGSPFILWWIGHYLEELSQSPAFRNNCLRFTIGTIIIDDLRVRWLMAKPLLEIVITNA